MGRELGHTLRCPALYDDGDPCDCEREAELIAHPEALARWGADGLERKLREGRVWPEMRSHAFALYWVDPLESAA